MYVLCLIITLLTPCVTKGELQQALKTAGYKIAAKGGYHNQASWREQAFKKVYEKYRGSAVCLEK